MTSGNGAKNNVIKSIIPGNVTITQDEHYFIKEQAFTQSQRFNFAAAQVMWFLIDGTNYTPGPTQELNRIIFRVPGVFAEAGPIHIDFYRSPTLGAAVATPLALPSFNRVSGSAITAQLELSSLNQAPDSLGTALSQILLPANATGVGNRSGDSVVEELPFNISITEPLLMVLTNTNGNDTDVGIRHGWFEI